MERLARARTRQKARDAEGKENDRKAVQVKEDEQDPEEDEEDDDTHSRL